MDEAAGTDRWVSGGPQTLAAMREAGIEPNSLQAGEILLYAVKKGKAEAVRSLLAAGAPSWTRVEGMALKWGRGTQHPKAAKNRGRNKTQSIVGKESRFQQLR